MYRLRVKPVKVLFWSSFQLPTRTHFTISCLSEKFSNTIIKYHNRFDFVQLVKWTDSNALYLRRQCLSGELASPLLFTGQDSPEDVGLYQSVERRRLFEQQYRTTLQSLRSVQWITFAIQRERTYNTDRASQHMLNFTNLNSHFCVWSSWPQEQSGVGASENFRFMRAYCLSGESNTSWVLRTSRRPRKPICTRPIPSLGRQQCRFWNSSSVCLVDKGVLKLQELVNDVLFVTAAIISYAIGLRNLSANWQVLVGDQIALSLL